MSLPDGASWCGGEQGSGNGDGGIRREGIKIRFHPEASGSGSHRCFESQMWGCGGRRKEERGGDGDDDDDDDARLQQPPDV